MTDMLTIKEYAALVGKAEASVRQKCQRGNVTGAVKIGRDWFIPKDTTYEDHRANGLSTRWAQDKDK